MTIEERIKKIEENQQILLKALWTIRGENKGLGNTLEKQLSQMWDEYLKSGISANPVVQSENN